MKFFTVTFFCSLFLFSACKTEDEIFEEQFQVCWSADSVTYDKGDEHFSNEMDLWNFQITEDSLILCLGYGKTSSLYKTTTEGDKRFFIITDNQGKEKKSEITELDDKHLILEMAVTSKENGAETKRYWHHSRISEEEFEESCNSFTYFQF